MPTSKPMLELLARCRPRLVILDGDAGWREAALAPATYVHADPTATARSLAGHDAIRTAPANEAWTADWIEADRAAEEAMRLWLGTLHEPFEGLPWPILADALPDGAVLWASSSMPVRDMDAWLPSTDRAITVRSNRGANGIDGVVSTAVGVALAGAPTALLIGDVALLHDTNGLLGLAGRGVDLCIVVVDNDGGGIFSFLPQAGALPPERFEHLFGTPHGVDLTALAVAHDLPVLEAHDDESAEVAVRAALTAGGVHLVRVRTDRAANVVLHDELHAATAAAVVGAALGGGA
jgi:2-succinyl-5-enolpyruvyl-6-hydroxy-3-cyclohexene-1-carboxylate synthase